MSQEIKIPRSKAPKDLLLEAKQVSGRGDLEGAARQLVSLAEQYPDDMDVRLTCAAVLFRLKRYTDAALHFERILKDRPVYEWASLGLFHSLWKADKKHEAIEEIRRFRDAGGDSMEYRRFFKDLEKFR
jgi:predicted Zn-dependent protease